MHAHAALEFTDFKSLFLQFWDSRTALLWQGWTIPFLNGRLVKLYFCPDSWTQLAFALLQCGCTAWSLWIIPVGVFFCCCCWQLLLSCFFLINIVTNLKPSLQMRKLLQEICQSIQWISKLDESCVKIFQRKPEDKWDISKSQSVNQEIEKPAWNSFHFY